jgi:sec-independent protein translocase protein TatB
VFNVGWGEVLMLAIVGLVVLGPERLPKYAAEAGRVVRKLREMAKDATGELRAELGPEMADIDLADLANPRRLVARYLLDAGDAEAAAAVVSAGEERSRSAAGPPLLDGERPPYDVDAT